MARFRMTLKGREWFTPEEEAAADAAQAEWEAGADDRAAEAVRTQRNALLAETDWMGLSDVVMSDEMTTYRQALRDITSHENFPNLEDADWPTKPE